MKFKKKKNLTLTELFVILIISIVTNNCSLVEEPEQTDLDPEFDVTIIAYNADTGSKLAGADVILKANPYRHGTTNSSGEITFRDVQQHGFKLHLEIMKSESNPEKYYHFQSNRDGYSGGIDFYSLPNHTFEVHVKNIL